MKKLTTSILLLASAISVYADTRVNIRLGTGHPIRRTRTVVVRPMRPGVVVAPRLVFAPPVVWRRTVVTLPPRERLIWQDSETLRRREDWVDTDLGVNQRGDKLYLRIDGRAQIDFAEVHFQNGNVQVVDFQEGPMQAGTYSLLDFSDGRHVTHVRMVARARTPEARLTVLMAR
jgi:hypothetical protein